MKKYNIFAILSFLLGIYVPLDFLFYYLRIPINLSLIGFTTYIFYWSPFFAIIFGFISFYYKKEGAVNKLLAALGILGGLSGFILYMFFPD